MFPARKSMPKEQGRYRSGDDKTDGPAEDELWEVHQLVIAKVMVEGLLTVSVSFVVAAFLSICVDV